MSLKSLSTSCLFVSRPVHYLTLAPSFVSCSSIQHLGLLLFFGRRTIHLHNPSYSIRRVSHLCLSFQAFCAHMTTQKLSPSLRLKNSTDQVGFQIFILTIQQQEPCSRSRLPSWQQSLCSPPPFVPTTTSIPTVSPCRPGPLGASRRRPHALSSVSRLSPARL